MVKETLGVNGEIWTRVSKAQARRLFVEGKPIQLLPVNVLFDNWWIKPVEIRNFPVNLDRDVVFDQLVGSYEYYNCTPELGRYAKFFAKL